MKRCIGMTVLIASLFLSQQVVDAATAAAFSSRDGNMGLGNGRTVDSAKSQAIASCRGTNPAAVAWSTTNGWCAICKSKNSAGQWVFGAALGYSSQRDAATAARTNLVRNGGYLDNPSKGYFIITQLLNQY
jgi:hypothetical protein